MKRHLTIALFAALLITVSAGLCFAGQIISTTGGLVPAGLSSVGEAAAQENLDEIYCAAAQNYIIISEIKRKDGGSELMLADIGYGTAKVLKPIYIICYANSLAAYRAQSHQQLASRSGRYSPNQRVTVDIAPIIEKCAEKYNVDPHLIRAIIKTESNFSPYAMSYCGAGGLMQLMPGTASALGVRNIFDPEQNIEGGTKYFKGLLERMKDVTLAIASYNAGPYNVMKWGGVPPFTETRNFVNRVMKHYYER